MDGKWRARQLTSVGPSKLGRRPVKSRRLAVVVLLLEDDGPDPGSDESDGDGAERSLGSGVDVDLLSVDEVSEDERRENSSEVGEERREGSGSDVEVLGEEGREERVVEVADEEGCGRRQ